MKRTIFISSLIFAIVFSVLYFGNTDVNANENIRETSGFLMVNSSHPNTGGVYCGTSSGSFTTNNGGGARIYVPNGTYTVCVGNESVSGIVVNNNFVDVYTDDGAACPCGN